MENKYIPLDLLNTDLNLEVDSKKVIEQLAIIFTDIRRCVTKKCNAKQEISVINTLSLYSNEEIDILIHYILNKKVMLYALDTPLGVIFIKQLLNNSKINVYEKVWSVFKIIISEQEDGIVYICTHHTVLLLETLLNNLVESKYEIISAIKNISSTDIIKVIINKWGNFIIKQILLYECNLCESLNNYYITFVFDPLKEYMHTNIISFNCNIIHGSYGYKVILWLIECITKYKLQNNIDWLINWILLDGINYIFDTSYGFIILSYIIKYNNINIDKIIEYITHSIPLSYTNIGNDRYKIHYNNFIYIFYICLELNKIDSCLRNKVIVSLCYMYKNIILYWNKQYNDKKLINYIISSKALLINIWKYIDENERTYISTELNYNFEELIKLNYNLDSFLFMSSIDNMS